MTGFDYLKKFLQEEGFRFTDDDSFISFKFEGNTFLAFKNDSPYLQVLQLLNVANQSRSKLLEVCNKMNDEKFVIKFTVHDDRVWCSFESKPTDRTTADEFSLMMTLLDRASDDFFEELNK